MDKPTFPQLKKKFWCEIDAPEFIPEGWTVVEDVDPPSDLSRGVEFAPFVKNSETYIKGDTMCQPVVEFKGNNGLCFVKYLLAHQELIPIKFRGETCIVFASTVLRRPGGFHYIPCLNWDGERWVLFFLLWLAGSDWHLGGGPMVRCK